MTDSSEIQNIIDAALYFAERGIRVFPVEPDGKRPAVKAWQSVATADQNSVADWFMREFRGANLGVVADDLIVLDVDTVHHGAGGKDGPASLRRLIAENGPLPETFTVETASGGFHYYFRDRSGSGDTFTKGADKFGPDYPGLDIQTKNAYLVGPFSAVGGFVYSVHSHADIADLPDWLRLLIRDTYRELPARPPQRGPGQPVNSRYVNSAISGELTRLDDLQRDGWGGAPWDQTTYEVAANLIEISNGDGSDYPLSAAFSDFMAHAPADAKFGPRQHEAKWNSALRKVGSKARVFPAPRSQQAGPAHTPAGAGSPKLGPIGRPADTGNMDTSEGAEHPPAGDSQSPAVIGPPDPPEESSGPPAGDPDDYFGKHGLRVEAMAQDVKAGFALGPDKELWIYRDGIFMPDSLELLRRVTVRLGDRYRPGHFNAVQDFVRALPEIRELTNGAPDQRYIVLSNGVYSWQDMELLPHSQRYGAITKLPVVYDAEAECPEFDRYLSEVVPPDTISTVWEVIGYLCMFGNPLQQAVVLQGPGGNGKSAFLNMLQHLLGETNISALSLRQMTEDRFAVAGLVGMTANLAGDIDSKYLADSSRFKQVVGGDLIEVERKFGQPFKFRPYVVPVFSANEFWKTGDTTRGYWRRWLPIPFPYPVDKSERRLIESDLWAETPGIFNRAMVGLRTLMARGEFQESDSIRDLRNKFEAAADVLADWFEEDSAISINDPSRDSIRTPRTEVYQAFSAWSTFSRHKGMSSSNFYRRLAQLGYVETKYRGTRCIVGLEISSMRQPALEYV